MTACDINVAGLGGDPKSSSVYLKVDPDGSDSVRGKSAKGMMIVVKKLVSNEDIITASG